jgi:hypothetical protein
MTGPIGLNPEQLRTLIAKLVAASRQTEQARQLVSGALTRTWWTGSDAIEFRSHWQTGTNPELAQLIANYEVRISELRRQLDDQLRTSESGEEPSTLPFPLIPGSWPGTNGPAGNPFGQEPALLPFPLHPGEPSETEDGGNNAVSPNEPGGTNPGSDGAEHDPVDEVEHEAVPAWFDSSLLIASEATALVDALKPGLLAVSHVGTALGFLGITADVMKAFGAHGDEDLGDWDTVWHLVHGVGTGVGIVIPEVGLVVLSWDFGTVIGHAVDDPLGGFLNDQAIEALYGKHPTPQQLEEYIHRYDGVTGFPQWAVESVAFPVYNAGYAAGSAVHHGVSAAAHGAASAGGAAAHAVSSGVSSAIHHTPSFLHSALSRLRH